MVTAILVENEITEGKRLVEALDQHRFRFNAAMWMFSQSTGERRFVIATPLLDERGPRDTYTEVQAILEAVNPQIGIPLREISVISPTAPLIKNLRKNIRISKKSEHPIFTNIHITSEYGESAYVYRMR